LWSAYVLVRRQLLEVNAVDGDVHRARKPEMVKKLHAFAQRSIDECAKMEAKKAE
jgi:hypothetical protein